MLTSSHDYSFQKEKTVYWVNCIASLTALIASDRTKIWSKAQINAYGI